MKVYLTKYGLTDGIIEIEDADYPGENQRNLFTDFEAAVKRVEEMRDLRIASLEKQIVKLHSLDCRKLAKGDR